MEFEINDRKPILKAACFSVAAMDYFPLRDEYYAGGNSLNQALCFKKQGFESAFIGALGTDEAGDRIEALLAANAINKSHTHRVCGKTASNRIINDEAGERFGEKGAWNGGVYEDYLLSEADWHFLAGFDVWATHGNSPAYLGALERKQPQQFMSVDFLHLLSHQLLLKSLAVIDIAYIGGDMGMVDALSQIAKNTNGLIVLTLGAEGSIAFKGDAIYKQAALPIGKVIDTTGCGDAFQAAFTATYFQSRDVQTALLAGAESGREAALHFGGCQWN